MKSITETRQKFTQLSLFSDDQSAEVQRLAQQLQQREQLLSDILLLVHQNMTAGKPSSLGAAILRLAAQYQGEVGA